MTSGSSATNLQSVRNAKKNLTRFLKQQQTIPQEVLAREAPRIQAEAKLLTPLRSGRLEHNVHCRISRSLTRPGLNISATAISAGYNYAGIQHENMYFKHPIKGQAHYLVIPFNAGVERIVRDIRRELKYGN